MRVNTKISAIIVYPLLMLIRFYQLFISPLIGQNCRFHPTCSCYAHQALKTHGVLRGGLLSIKRIVKCQPLHPGGIDNVPPATTNNKSANQKNNINAIHSIENNKLDKTVRNSALKDTIKRPTF